MGVIYLDSCLLVYVIEDDPAFGPNTQQRLTRAADAEDAVLAISPLVRLECLVGPMKSGDRALRLRYERALSLLRLLDMPPAVYDGAAELRARYGLRTPDALHLACAQHHGCQALWTNDDRLARASHGLAVGF
ncbi:MAG: type II toxin-antitoxin system VapC family toxin [Rubrivivax sp.]|jgi:predicted nucleic acid-binding protein|nr:type II toxin-antitoxin system VapC family toxin [Rubrivivax sp.]